MESLDWRSPCGEVPTGWVEKHAIIGEWWLRVWFSSCGHWEAVLIHSESRERRRLEIGYPANVEEACKEAEDTAKRILSLT